MGKKIDLTGQRFGRLVVIEETAKKNGNITWSTICDCGNKKDVLGEYLRNGDTQSCGCLQKQSISELGKKPSVNSIDLIGRRFGRLKVINKTTKRIEGNIVWECQCNCGNKAFVTGNNLRGKQTKSCGCLYRENVKKAHDFVNENDRKESTRLSMLTDKKNINNTSGVKGVSWAKRNKRWLASIGFKGKNIYLGEFHNKQDAINARKEAEDKYFKPILEKYGKESK